MKEENKYGYLTIGAGTGLEKQLAIVDIVQSQFKDNRLVTIAGIEGGTYLVSVENPQSSGRVDQKMWLSEESFLAFFGAMAIYSNCKGWDLVSAAKQSAKENGIEYHFSDNLKKFNPNEVYMANSVGPKEEQGSTSQSTCIPGSGEAEEEEKQV